MSLFKKKKVNWHSIRVDESDLDEALTDLSQESEIVSVMPLEIKDKNDFIIVCKK